MNLASRGLWVCWFACVVGGGLAGCTSASTCAPGTLNVNGNCVVAGDASVQADGSARDGGNPCGPSAKLVGGACVLDPGALPGAVGAACNSNTDCVGSTTCAQSSMLPSGYCTVVDCDAQHPCPVGSLCYAVSSTLSMCLATCDRHAACRAGNDYHCQPVYSGDVGVCMPSCTLSNACTAGSKCDAASGACVVDACDPKAKDACNASQTHDICYPDPSGTVTGGGYCVHSCDPQNQVSCNVQHGDVCQPLAADPVHTGFCSTPVCNNSEQCPAGSLCKSHVCEPPPACDSKGQCADGSLGCVGGAGGQCMPKCPVTKGQSCSDINSQLQCYAKGPTPVCLPTGSYPGSSCRTTTPSPCDSVSLGKGRSVPMVCDKNLCVPECSVGGNTACAAIDAQTACATRGGGVSECQPKGTFVGGPCANGQSCKPVDVGGGRTLPVSCEATLDLCLLDCSDNVPGVTPGKNDAYCSGLDSNMACARRTTSAAFPSDDVCLPVGSFAGGPCGAAGSCGSENGLPMACENGACLVTCSSRSDCSALGLVCAVGVYKDHNVCLPAGSFPGGPCDASNNCAQVLGGDPALNLTCRRNVCFLQCDETGKWPGYGQALCQTQDPALTCSLEAGKLCVPACSGKSPCSGASACFDPGTWPAHENACLPTGSFPGAPCSVGLCETSAIGMMSCLTNPVSFASSCYAQCTPDDPTTAANEDRCASLDPSYVCAHGYYTQDVCLVKGSFAGGPCVNSACGNDDDTKQPLTCEQGKCYIKCTPDLGAGQPDSCIAFDATQVCRTGVYADGICRPRGSYQGGPCAVDLSGGESCSTVDLGGALGVVPMACSSHVCRYDCTSNSGLCAQASGTTCQADSPTLSVCR
jgi:hypothetical protein